MMELFEAAADRATSAPRAYRYRHRVSFEETNLMGNVYFARFISWQGRCRELFLLDHAPGVLAELDGALRIVTLSTRCEYFAEVRALDKIEVGMSLTYQRQNRIGLAFEYRRLSASAETSVARGMQEIGCMRHTPGGLVPCPVPGELAAALDRFR
jgi:enediyne biosynthesis thioesterase